MTSTGSVVCFYSPEDNPDSTSVLLEVANILARSGYRVNCVDWDFRHQRLTDLLNLRLDGCQGSGTNQEISLSYGEPHSGESLSLQPGIIDLFQAIVIGSHQPQPSELSRLVPLQGEHGSISFTGVGSNSLRIKGDCIDWQTLYTTIDVGWILEALRTEWISSSDITLIDCGSGPGLSPSICAAHFADILCISSLGNAAALSETKEYAQQIESHRRVLPYDRSSLLVIPLFNEDDIPESFPSPILSMYGKWLPHPVESYAPAAAEATSLSTEAGISKHEHSYHLAALLALRFENMTAFLSSPNLYAMHAFLSHAVVSHVPPRFDQSPQEPGGQEWKLNVVELLGALSERERRLLGARFGLSGGKPKTLEELGYVFGAPPVQIRMWLYRTLKKLRHAMQAHEAPVPRPGKGPTATLHEHMKKARARSAATARRPARLVKGEHPANDVATKATHLADPQQHVSPTVEEISEVLWEYSFERNEVLRASPKFAAYAPEDRSTVGLCLEMLRLSADIIDDKGILPGDNWKNDIDEKIRIADCLLLFWSKAAQSSISVEYAWRTALANRISILPVVLDHTSLPKDLASLRYVRLFN